MSVLKTKFFPISSKSVIAKIPSTVLHCRSTIIHHTPWWATPIHRFICCGTRLGSKDGGMPKSLAKWANGGPYSSGNPSGATGTYLHSPHSAGLCRIAFLRLMQTASVMQLGDCRPRYWQYPIWYGLKASTIILYILCCSKRALDDMVVRNCNGPWDTTHVT